MSQSPRSKSASPSSPGTGAEPKAEAEPAATKPADAAARGRTLEIELEPSRQRAASWAIFGILLGLVFVWQLGTVAVWVGYVLIAIGLYRAFELARSFAKPAGTIVVSDREVVLPRAPHRGGAIQVAPKDVTAAYFLRKNVPWNRASPVLVVELGARALTYPRDWFASEADQRQVIHALRRHLPAAAPAAPEV
jgi:hypothetical protein